MAFNRRRKLGLKEDKEEWLLTYTDAVTLLLAFFVLILQVSDINQNKFEEVYEGISQGLLKEKNTVTPLTDVKRALDQIFAEHNVQDQVQVVLDNKGITVEFASSSFYEIGSADIRENMYPVLNAMSEAFKNIRLNDFMIEVEGHTDDVPISTPRYPSNWELSVNRATNIVKHLQQTGINHEILKAAGYGESRPKVPNRAEDGTPIAENRAVNRRVVIWIHR
jgi:chemotaxis protein MotB